MEPCYCCVSGPGESGKFQGAVGYRVPVAPSLPPCRPLVCAAAWRGVAGAGSGVVLGRGEVSACPSGFHRPCAGSLPHLCAQGWGCWAPGCLLPTYPPNSLVVPEPPMPLPQIPGCASSFHPQAAPPSLAAPCCAFPPNSLATPCGPCLPKTPSVTCCAFTPKPSACAPQCLFLQPPWLHLTPCSAWSPSSLAVPHTPRSLSP